MAHRADGLGAGQEQSSWANRDADQQEHVNKLRQNIVPNRAVKTLSVPWKSQNLEFTATMLEMGVCRSELLWAENKLS